MVLSLLKVTKSVHIVINKKNVRNVLWVYNDILLKSKMIVIDKNIRTNINNAIKCGYTKFYIKNSKKRQNNIRSCIIEYNVIE
jgi:predicted nucleic-acid-binding Zn-ribbon protein